MNEQVDKQETCEHELEYISKNNDVSFYSDDGCEYYVDIAFYKCSKCGHFEVDFY